MQSFPQKSNSTTDFTRLPHLAAFPCDHTVVISLHGKYFYKTQKIVSYDWSANLVRLLVSARLIQPANNVFLSKKPAPASPNQHQHQPANRVACCYSMWNQIYCFLPIRLWQRTRLMVCDWKMHTVRCMCCRARTGGRTQRWRWQAIGSQVG